MEKEQVNTATVKKVFPVSGLSCASCAVSMETILKAQPGVSNAAVNFASKSALVEYSPTIVQPEELKTAAQSIGYDLILPTADKADTNILLKDAEHKAFVTLRNNFIGAAVLTVPLVIIGMFFMHMPYANYIMLALGAPVVLWFGRVFFVNAYKQARHGAMNMDTLVALSTGVAFVFSLFNTFYPQFWIERGLEPHVYYESAAGIVAFILLGRLLEEKAKAGASDAIKKLMGLQPEFVTVIDGTREWEVAVGELQPGMIIQVRSGDKIAVDGEVVEGSSFVDESMVTGEPMPAEKKGGDKVYSGTINQKGSFRFKAEKVGEETLLARIIATVQQAQGSKAPVQKLVDKVTAVFVPSVIAIAVITLIGWWALGGPNGFTLGLHAAITVLVIACPCALGLATPTAIMVGIGRGAEHNILIKDAESLEAARKVNAIVLDKTGTLTEGHPSVTDIVWVKEGKGLPGVLQAIEGNSEHPIAQAIVEYLKKDGVKAQALTAYESVTGKGAKATAYNDDYFVGSPAYFHEVTNITTLPAEVEQWQTQAKTVVFFFTEKKLLAAVAVADKLKATSVKAVQQLQQMGIEVHMLTGDNEQTAKAVAAQTGITTFKAGVMPSDKGAYVKQLQSSGKVVAMIGDGINDSEALAKADVSIAMGKGSDIAMDVAKMTLITSDLLSVPKAIQLSRKTVSFIRQNLFWAFVYNTIGIPLAAGILFPVNGFLLNPMLAGAAMALSSVSVVSNSLRLKYVKI